MIVVVEKLDCRGDITQYDQIKMIKDNNERYELVISENYQIVISKKRNRIIAITG